MVVRFPLLLLFGFSAPTLFVVGMVSGRVEDPPRKAPLVLSGRQSEIDVARYYLASSQEVFDVRWIDHMGERVQRTAQGRPMTPQIDFEAYEVVFFFGGDGADANGYRILDVIEESDAVTLRFERLSHATPSTDGDDTGDQVRPWAMVLVPATDKTILLEEQVQAAAGSAPVWKQLIAFPGLIGVGRTVGGTRQSGKSRQPE